MKVTWGQTIPVWWSMIWRSVLFGMLAGFVAGFFAGLLVHHPEKGELYGGIAGLIVSIPTSMFAMKQTLTKHLQKLAGIAQQTVQADGPASGGSSA